MRLQLLRTELVMKILRQRKCLICWICFTQINIYTTNCKVIVRNREAAMEATRKREIKRKAASFRTKCNAGQYGIIDLFKSCEECSFKLLRYPLGEDADLGFTLKKDDDIIVFTN